MAPVATETQRSNVQDESTVKDLKAKINSENNVQKVIQSFNPFYSPSIADDGDKTYEYERYKVCSLMQS